MIIRVKEALLTSDEVLAGGCKRPPRKMAHGVAPWESAASVAAAHAVH